MITPLAALRSKSAIKSADVIIYRDGDYAVAVDKFGNEIARGSLEKVFESAKNALTSNRTWIETILVKGDFNIKSPLKPTSFMRVVVNGYIRVEDNANCGIFVHKKTEGVLESFELIGGVYDGNAGNQSDHVFAVIELGAEQLKNVKVIDVKVVNAYAHGIYMIENTPSNYLKVIEKSLVYNIAVKSTGYGIYLDYSPKAVVRDNYVEPVQSVDAIEVGHGDYLVEGNIVVGGTINFPYASNTIIRNNTLYGATIQNDGNVSNNMLIEGNRIYGATPGSLYAGIRVSGDNAKIIGNYVEITNSESGIKVIGKYAKIIGNHVVQQNPTQGIGIKLEAHYSDVVSDNIIDGFDKGVVLSRDFSEVYGNTIKNCNTGIYFVPTTTSGHKMIGCRVTNNVFENVSTKIDTANQLDGNLVEDVVYEALPTYTDGYKKGDSILYYDGTYYYIAVWDGSQWRKVQVS